MNVWICKMCVDAKSSLLTSVEDVRGIQQAVPFSVLIFWQRANIWFHRQIFLLCSTMSVIIITFCMEINWIYQTQSFSMCASINFQITCIITCSTFLVRSPQAFHIFNQWNLQAISIGMNYILFNCPHASVLDIQNHILYSRAFSHICTSGKAPIIFISYKDM